MIERQRAVEVKVGAFVLASILILGLGVLWVVGSLPVGREANRYSVLMQTAAGVRQGDRVRVSGIEVGRVDNVSLRPGEAWPVLFEITLDASVAVTVEASARITSDGLLSSNYLEIDPGPPLAQPLPPGNDIEGAGAAGLMAALGGLEDLSGQASGFIEELETAIGGLSASLDPLLARLEILLSDENLTAFSDMLVSFRDLAEDTRPRTNTLLEDLDRLAKQIGEGAADLPQISAHLKGLLAGLETALGPDGERLAALVESTQSTMSSASATLEVTARNRRSLELALQDLEATMANLKSFTSRIAEQPSALVRKSRQPDRKPGEGNP